MTTVDSSLSPTPIRPSGVRLLALDGGGVKGISSLMILDEIMNTVRDLEIERGINLSEADRLPKDYFDLAAGTSTGGLIALMLFRLNMSVPEVVEQYKQLASSVFSPTMFNYPLHRLGPLGDQLGKSVLKVKAVFRKSQFSDKPLKKAIDKVVENYGQDEEDKRLKGEARLHHRKAGKMIMCSTLCDKGESILLRSYTLPKDAVPVSDRARILGEDGKIDNISIGVAARATSAAPTYLPEVDWHDISFWDGGLLNNNPIDQLWKSRYDLVGPKDAAPKVSCVLSLGTSWSTVKHSNPLRFVNTMSRAMSFMTNTEAKHRDFWRYLNRVKGRIDANANTEYFRFNTPTGNTSIGLDDYLKMGDLMRLTKDYLSEKGVKQQIDHCAELLVTP